MNIRRIYWPQWLMDKGNNSLPPCGGGLGWGEDKSAEILLAYILGVSRTWLHTHPEKIKLSSEQQKQFDDLLQRREQGEPIAYLIGKQEFWSLPLEVNSHTLVPRPETELLVELVLKISGGGKLTVADLGTGSGAIAIALAHERPDWQIIATDNNPDTLAVAKCNAAHIDKSPLAPLFQRGGKVQFYLGDWCAALPVGTQCDIIVSNPPYIPAGDPHLLGDGVRYEPRGALVSGADGLDDIRKIIQAAWGYLKPEGWLLLEHGYDQAGNIKELLKLSRYSQIKTYQDLAGLDRVTMGRI